MKLYSVNRPKGDNRYCGPAVISALTQMTTGEAARLLRVIGNRRQITGVDDDLMQRALAECGITTKLLMREPVKSSRPTLASWLKGSRELRKPGRVFLLVAGRHYQLISGRRYVCGLTREIVSIKDERVKRRARVAVVWELAAESITVPAAARKETKAAERPLPILENFTRLQLCELRAAADPAGIAVEWDDEEDYLTVYPPESLELDGETDPYHDDHMAWCVGEAMARISVYKDLLEKMK